MPFMAAIASAVSAQMVTRLLGVRLTFHSEATPTTIIESSAAPDAVPISSGHSSAVRCAIVPGEATSVAAQSA